MNLIELFDDLSVPDDFDSRAFYSTIIPGYANCRIATNSQGHPILLLSVQNPIERVTTKNFRFKYLEVRQNVECKIFEDNTKTFRTFTVIYFNCSDRPLQEYFLRVSEVLIRSIAENPTQKELIDSINRFVEIFRAISDPPSKTIQGLWSELFIISVAKKPEHLLSHWHNNPEEKFDFNAGLEKLEVKSNANLERIHFFSAEQLNPPNDSEVLVASLFVKKSRSGINIQGLIDRISDKINNEIELMNKLNFVVSRTLGSLIEESANVRFDYEIARESLKFYSHREISKIEAVHIPRKVSEVCFKSNLSACKSTELSELKENRTLYFAL